MQALSVLVLMIFQLPSLWCWLLILFFSLLLLSYKGRFIPFEDDAQRDDKYFIPLFDVLHNDDFDMRNSIVELESSWCIIIIVLPLTAAEIFLSIAFTLV